MQSITFITGNQKKADYLARYLGFRIEHIKLDLEEIQSMELQEIVEHKVKQAYEKIKKPVIVEDASLEFTALGKLPGPFIKFFIEEM
jgi:inosine triphosphate pyrophosphatase